MSTGDSLKEPENNSMKHIDNCSADHLTLRKDTGFCRLFCSHERESFGVVGDKPFAGIQFFHLAVWVKDVPTEYDQYSTSLVNMMNGSVYHPKVPDSFFLRYVNHAT